MPWVPRLGPWLRWLIPFLGQPNDNNFQEGQEPEPELPDEGRPDDVEQDEIDLAIQLSLLDVDDSGNCPDPNAWTPSAPPLPGVGSVTGCFVPTEQNPADGPSRTSRPTSTSPIPGIQWNHDRRFYCVTQWNQHPEWIGIHEGLHPAAWYFIRSHFPRGNIRLSDIRFRRMQSRNEALRLWFSIYPEHEAPEEFSH